MVFITARISYIPFFTAVHIYDFHISTIIIVVLFFCYDSNSFLAGIDGSKSTDFFSLQSSTLSIHGSVSPLEKINHSGIDNPSVSIANVLRILHYTLQCLIQM